MDVRWWQLPGPSGFLSRIVGDIRDGRNVIIRLPEQFPDGLPSALRAALGDGEGWSWHRFGVEPDSGLSPAGQLCDYFVPDTPPEAILNARTLARESSFKDKIIWLDGIAPANWPQWKEFLAEYAHACRLTPQLGRTLFVVPLAGQMDPPSEDICLAHQQWNGCIDRLDMMLYTAGLIPPHRMNDLQRRLAVAVITNLALWDPVVAIRLAAQDLRTILSPLPILRGIAAERGWSETTPVAWHVGTSHLVAGEEVTHSAVLLSHPEEIHRRIWSAEVGVLLPYVEERRQEILAQLRKVLRVPWKTRFGVIENLYDLEIGHIESQILERKLQVSPRLVRTISRLREIRNKLAHLEPVSPELVLEVS